MAIPYIKGFKVVLSKVFDKPPILIYQMGKVGSTSLYETLSHYLPNTIEHAHSPSMVNNYELKNVAIRKALSMPINIISPIREPVSRNLSAFFHNFKKIIGVDFSSKEWTYEEVRELYLKRYGHHKGIGWFDKELKPISGIDVYSEQFPKKEKWKVYKKGKTRILVYRLDLEKQKQLELISEFLGINIPEWKMSNVAEEKDYGEFYINFCKQLSLPKEYLDYIYSSKLATHFWTKEELESEKRRWQKK
ncbi:MAG: putative capsular polysaccharide synthesis family protein [Melioribacteraceae bacterium]|nr:putative capsular polysaccharide synthesis family protein [Melioribacteraceae bacterium]MCF8262882.1 putative capsular polysaccharide synthesis family protein [Melioribacteraceae bacterium]MCF8430890.1 putative capsular polysaccharide synthesis family protein [Melioribacteraceae bacterium]